MLPLWKCILTFRVAKMLQLRAKFLHDWVAVLLYWHKMHLKYNIPILFENWWMNVKGRTIPDPAKPSEHQNTHTELNNKSNCISSSLPHHRRSWLSSWKFAKNVFLPLILLLHINCMYRGAFSFWWENQMGNLCVCISYRTAHPVVGLISRAF